MAEVATRPLAADDTRALAAVRPVAVTLSPVIAPVVLTDARLVVPPVMPVNCVWMADVTPLT